MINTCAAGFANCDGQAANGCEVSLNSNAQNCGSCSNNCLIYVGGSVVGATCVNMNCELECAAGLAECDGILANKCETNVNTYVQNCLSCGTNCTSLANVNPSLVSCSPTGCVIASACLSPYFDCDGRASNGCEANLGDDTLNCGTCLHSCYGANVAVPQCTSGRRAPPLLLLPSQPPPLVVPS